MLLLCMWFSIEYWCIISILNKSFAFMHIVCMCDIYLILMLNLIMHLFIYYLFKKNKMHDCIFVGWNNYTLSKHHVWIVITLYANQAFCAGTATTLDIWCHYLPGNYILHRLMTWAICTRLYDVSNFHTVLWRKQGQAIAESRWFGSNTGSNLGAKVYDVLKRVSCWSLHTVDRCSRKALISFEFTNV